MTVPAHNGLSAVGSDVPRHVACIMDGNGRWAERRGLTRIHGHAAGEAAIVDAVDAAIDMGVQWLTLFAFSTENWNRPDSEVAFLMKFAGLIINRHGEAFHNRNIRVRYMGRMQAPVPTGVLAKIKQIQRKTSSNDGLTVTFAFNYGGRTEIIDAIARLVASEEPASTESLSASMYWPDMPPPDLVIRFGGERRLSNFLLWHIAYAELEFSDLLWPDVRRHHFAAAVRTYETRGRRFGSIEADAS